MGADVIDLFRQDKHWAAQLWDGIISICTASTAFPIGLAFRDLTSCIIESGNNCDDLTKRFALSLAFVVGITILLAGIRELGYKLVECVQRCAKCCKPEQKTNIVQHEESTTIETEMTPLVSPAQETVVPANKKLVFRF